KPLFDWMILLLHKLFGDAIFLHIINTIVVIEKELSNSTKNQIALYSFNNSKMLPNRCQPAMSQAEKCEITQLQQACTLFPLNRSRRL
ncbi:MAG: hypothetical protein ACI4I6_10595, partial [Hominimerdicola sp.]